MREEMLQTDVQIYQDLDTLSKAVADRFLDVVTEASKLRSYYYVALTGGNTVRNLYVLLSHPPYIDEIDWSKGHLFWGDERLVPPDHSESNFRQSYDLLLRHVGVKPENIYRVRGELERSEAVEDYRIKLRENASEGLEWPRFDLVLLGMGSDGHVASIFPGHPTEGNFPVISTSADYEGRPALRVSLTPPVFNSAREIFFLVAGEGKASALEKVFCGDSDPENFPALRIHPKMGRVTWFVDQAAASYLPKEFRNP
jgi:6-phosphogluconolactonase